MHTIDKAVLYLKDLEDKQTGIEYFETVILYILSAAKNLTRKDMETIARSLENNYPEGSEIIMTLADMLREEGKEQGKEEGIRATKEAIVKNAIKEGMEFRLIEKLTGLSNQEIEEIARDMKK